MIRPIPAEGLAAILLRERDAAATRADSNPDPSSPAAIGDAAVAGFITRLAATLIGPGWQEVAGEPVPQAVLACDVYEAIYDGISTYGLRMQDRGDDGAVRDRPANGLVDWATRRIFAGLIDANVYVGNWRDELFQRGGDPN